jgi:hypothetical protein
LNPFLEGEEFFTGESVERAKGGYKSRFQIDRMVVLPVWGEFVSGSLFKQGYEVVVFLGYQPSDFIVLRVRRRFTGGFFEGLKQFVNRDASREFFVL